MHAAAEVIAGEVMQGNEELAQKPQPAALNARVIPSVAYTGPGVAWVGLAGMRLHNRQRAWVPGSLPSADAVSDWSGSNFSMVGF